MLASNLLSSAVAGSNLPPKYLARNSSEAALKAMLLVDLRRTAAKLCRAKGGELEQIQFLLGHESILTTERYLGSEQDLKNAVNDALVFE